MNRFAETAGILLVGWLMTASADPAAAQQALALSGGGTRGLAHVGVLQGLEEAGYDPEIVVGTSMGALVGALYAAGYSPAEIRDRVLEMSWAQVFDPTPVVIGPDRAVRYPTVNIDINIEQLRAARGLVGQWRINRILARLLFDANARARGDFDRLPRRYRAVAADLLTGEAVVLAEGDLARAARASMSVPGIFAPVAWGDRILVDGGITDNMPTGVARRLGARQVIAVDVSRPPEDIHGLSPVAVIGRAIDIIQENTQRDTIAPDALVLPDLDPGLSAASFPIDPRPLFERGLEAARRDLPPASPADGRGEPPPAIPPDSLRGLLLEAPDSSLAALARRVFGRAVPGPYDPEAVLDAMDRLYATGLFEGVWPRVVEDPENGPAGGLLLVRLETPPRLGFGGSAGYENDRGLRAWADLGRYGRLGRYPLVLTAGVSMNGIDRWASLGGRLYPLSTPAYAWTAGVYLRERDVRLFAGDATRNFDVRRAGAWAGIEFPQVLGDRIGSLNLQGEWIYQEEGRSGWSGGPVVRFTSLNPDIMVVGEPLLAEAEVRVGDVEYARLAIRGSQARSLGPLRVAALADLRLTSRETPADLHPALGDDHAIPGLRWGEGRGRSRAVLGLDSAYPLGPVFLRLRLRSGAVADHFSDLAERPWTLGSQIGIAWITPLISAEWGFGMTDGGDKRFDFSIGRHF